MLNVERERWLRELTGRGVSIWDLYDESGIGEERNEIASRFTRGRRSVLDVATGRGYFAFACARKGSRTTAIDVMDGEQRAGWWKGFLESSGSLGLDKVVNGVRSDASFLPFRAGGFEAEACIHAIRNILNPECLQATMMEMHRVAAKHGTVIVAESSVEPESRAEEVYLDYLKLRAVIGWEARIPNAEELERLLEEAGFSRVKRTIMRFDRDYAPVEFPPYIISGLPARIRREHERIERQRSKNGIKPTAVVVESAVA
jgi:ubiquinone/menaquinone biosynthesis C-methylase UbiE